MARLETTASSIKLIEFREGDGHWLVRWDFKPKLDENGNEKGVYWYEEEAYNWIPTIEDIQRTIVDWCNKQTDGIIKNSFEWKGIPVLLSEENKFNFALFAIEAERRENLIKKWDEENPEHAGQTIIITEGVDTEGNVSEIQIPTGRPSSRLPITFKLGEGNDTGSFYTFETIEELFEFTSASADHLQGSYGAGWYKIGTFDWTPYIQALEEL